MRDYGKVAPQFWTGETGRKLKASGAEAVVVAMYLMTSPHATMTGLYYLPKLYLAHDTGLDMEGASKGLARACEAGFCTYDEASEYVFVHAMARYQVGESLKADDNRCKGVRNELSKVPKGPLLKAFIETYGAAFHLQDLSPSEAPSKPLRSQEQEQEQEQEQKEKAKRPSRKGKESTLPEWLDSLAGEPAVAADDPIFAWAASTGIPAEWIGVAWWVFEGTYTEKPKTYADWRAAFRDHVKRDFLRVWRLDARDNRFVLTTAGEQARREMGAA